MSGVSIDQGTRDRERKMTKIYPGKCVECQGPTMPVVESYKTFRKDSLRQFFFVAPNVPIIKCSSCGEIFLTNESEHVINEFAASKLKWDKCGITILCGFPGCGKSTFLDKNHPDSIIISPDDFRLALTGKEYFGPAEDSVWSHVKIAARVLAGIRKKPIIIDATHLTKGSRGQWVRLAQDIGVPINCLWLDTPFEVCLERNLRRQRVVPEDVMNRMRDTFEPPDASEGFMVIKPEV